MSRVLIVLLTVLLVSSAALADIPDSFMGVYQTQSQVGTIANTIDIAHGNAGENTVSLQINNGQEVGNVHHVWASQDQFGFLYQVGGAHSDSGTVSLLQEMGSAGAQVQMIGSGIDPKYQGQTNGLAATQALAKMGGFGAGEGWQIGKVSSAQHGENAAGDASQTSAINSFQNSSYRGEPGNTGMVTSEVTALTEQEQFVY